MRETQLSLDPGIAPVRETLIRLGLLDEVAEPEFTRLSGGVSSDIWLVEGVTGPLCVKRALPQLRVNEQWVVPVERSVAEVAWLRWAGTIVPDAVPRVIAHDPVTNLFVMPYFDTATHPVWKHMLLDGVIDPAVAQLVGEKLGRIHARTAGDEVIAAEFSNDHIFFSIRLEPYLLHSGRQHPDCAGALAALVEITQQKRLALVHGDVSPKNILVGPTGPIFLDAECACYGDPAFDLAFCLNHLLLKCVVRRQYIEEYLRCFDVLTATYLTKVTWEPTADLGARAAALLPGLMLARIDGKSPVEYLTVGEDKYTARVFARRLLLEPVRALEAIRIAWEAHLANA
ncbi:MAG: phosphotransferase [Gammaproteobacteria bacterium]|nr:phosphotransferase [Gammaproteobacteria bacterium]